ncbi:MAG TPA: hypothetical protein VKD72_31980, partial [Gemmataceae bacterium]|nr:hypothetical protein [Gemmataceae bacterium]
QKKINDLRQIGLAYHNCCDATQRAPTKVDDLAPFYEKDARITQALTNGDYIFLWGVKPTVMIQGTSNTVLAYERSVPISGGLVLMGDGSVKKMTQQEFVKAPKAGK